MNRSAILGAAALVVVACVYLTSKRSDYSEQFITLPSGMKAHCNRQGYRTVGITPITDTQGEFVECDARVGPPWDDIRVGPDGELLTFEQARSIALARQQAEMNSPEAMRKRRENQVLIKANTFENALGPTECPSGETSRIWFNGLSREQKLAIDWDGELKKFRTTCRAEMSAAEAEDHTPPGSLEMDLALLQTNADACEEQYRSLELAYKSNPTDETEANIRRAAESRGKCLAPIKQARLDAIDRY